MVALLSAETRAPSRGFCYPILQPGKQSREVAPLGMQLVQACSHRGPAGSLLLAGLIYPCAFSSAAGHKVRSWLQNSHVLTQLSLPTQRAILSEVR